jgi:hypothetical protein
MFMKMPRFQKKYVAFFAIVPFLLTTAMVKVDCPIDGGTGMVSSAPGMENVEIIDTTSAEKFAARDATVCGMYFMYLYDVTLTVANNGPDDTWGYVELVLVDLGKTENQVVDKQYVVIEIPGETQLDVSYTVWFKSKDDRKLLRSEIPAKVLVDDIPCSISDGTGTIPLNTWLFINSLRDTFQELGREAVDYVPPVQWDPATEQLG